jgi:hypothetical protein
MKRLEQILAVIVLISLVMKLFSIPFAGELFTLSVSILIIMYTYFGWLLFNDIRLRNMTKRVYYVGIPKSRIICTIGLGFGTGLVSSGVLFRIQLWPMTNEVVIFGLIVTSVSLLIILLASLKSTGKLLKRNIIRITTVVILGTASLFVSELTLMEVYHGDHPEYIKAYENYLKNPDSEEAVKRLEIEECRAFMTEKEFEQYMKSINESDQE